MNIHHESIDAVDLPEVIRGMIMDGLTPQIRPRGPVGSQTGVMPVRLAMLNPEPYSKRDMYRRVTHTYEPLQTILVIGLGKEAHYWPLTYPSGRAVTFRVFA